MDEDDAAQDFYQLGSPEPFTGSSLEGNTEEENLMMSQPTISTEVYGSSSSQTTCEPGYHEDVINADGR
jgi:hypothetical protein